MNRLYYMLLVLFSLFYVTGATATVDWDGSFSGQSDGFQRGDRIIPGHMNEIDAALDSIKADVDGLTESAGDFIEVDGVETTPLGAPGFNLVPGDGINITLDITDTPDSGTFGIDLFPTGPGLAFSANQLTLLRTCADNQILQWDPTAGWECQNISSVVSVNGLAVAGATGYNFNSTTPAAALGSINLPFALNSTDVSVSLALSSITSLGTLTTQLALDEDGISFQARPGGDVTCNDQFPGGNGIYFDGTAFKKCVNGTLSDMDTNGAATALQGTASGSIDMATHQLTGDYQCVAESIVSISTDEVYACLATPAGAAGADFASLMKIMVTPDRPNATDPEVGGLIELAIDACHNSSLDLDIDNSSSNPIGCIIEVAAGKYIESTPRHFNIEAAAPAQPGRMTPITIDLSGSSIRTSTPDPSQTGVAFGSLTTTCSGLSDFGNFAIINDATSNEVIGAGGGPVTLPIFCNGSGWEIGHAMWTFGGQSQERQNNLTINMPILRSDITLNGDGREAYSRVMVISGQYSTSGGLMNVTLNGGRLLGDENSIIGSTILDIGGDSAGSTSGLYNVTVNDLGGFYTSSAAPTIRVRNSTAVVFNNLSLVNSASIRIGQDIAGETYPRGVIIDGLLAASCGDGPCLELVSGDLDIRGSVIFGDSRGTVAGNLARIGGAVAPGVQLISDGARWSSLDASDGRVFVGNVTSWYQRGGNITVADGNTVTNPMFVADNGAEIFKISVDANQTNTTDTHRVVKLSPVSYAEIGANSFRDMSVATTPADICFNVECEQGYDAVLVLDDPQTASQEYAEFLAKYIVETRGINQSGAGVPLAANKVKIVYALTGANAINIENNCYDGDVDRDDIGGTNGTTYVGDWPYRVCFGYHPVRRQSDYTLGTLKGWPDSSGVLDPNAPHASQGGNQRKLQITHAGRIEIVEDGMTKNAALFEWGNAWLAGTSNTIVSTSANQPAYAGAPASARGGEVNPANQCVDNFNATSTTGSSGVDWFADAQDTARYPWDKDGTLSGDLAAFPDGHCDDVYSKRIDGFVSQGRTSTIENTGDISIVVPRNIHPAAGGEEGVSSMSTVERFSSYSASTLVYWANNGAVYQQDNRLRLDIQNWFDTDDIAYHHMYGFGSSPPEINMIQSNRGTGAVIHAQANFAQPAKWTMKNLSHTIMFGDPENGHSVPGWELRCLDSFNAEADGDTSPDGTNNQTQGTPDGFCDVPGSVAVGPGRPRADFHPRRCPSMAFTSLAAVDGQLDQVNGDSKVGACRYVDTTPRGFNLEGNMGEGPVYNGILFATGANRIDISGYYEGGKGYPDTHAISFMPYFCDGVSGTGTIKPRGSAVEDPVKCTSNDNGSALWAEPTVWTKGQTSPGAAKIGYNDDNAGVEYDTSGLAGGSHGNDSNLIILRLDNAPFSASHPDGPFGSRGWNYLLGAGCGDNTEIILPAGATSGMGHDTQKNEFHVSDELLAGNAGCKLTTELLLIDGTWPVFDHGTLTTSTTLDDVSKAYSKFSATASSHEAHRSSIYVMADSGRPLIRTDEIHEAIELACEKNGNRQQKCAEVVIPPGVFDISTLYLTGSGVGPSKGLSGEGITGLHLRGSGGMSKDADPANPNPTECATTLRWDANTWDARGEYPAIWIHGGRNVTISDLCIVMDGGQDGVAGAETPIGVLITADDAEGEESYGVRLDNVSINGFSSTYTASNEPIATTCVHAAPYLGTVVAGNVASAYDEFSVGANPLRTTSYPQVDTVDNVVISNSSLACDYGFVGSAGNSERNSITNTEIIYGITGVWAEDSGISVTGGSSTSYARWGGGGWAPGEDVTCNNTEEWMKISQGTSSVYVADHTVDADCGIGVHSSHNNFASYLPVDMVNTTLRVGGETQGGLTDTQDYVINLETLTTGHFKFSGSVEALYGEDFLAAARVNGTIGGPAYVDMTGSNLWDWDLPFGSGGVNVSQTGFTGQRAPNGWVGVVKQQTDSRFGLADNTIASWREDQFAFENKISIGTIPNTNGYFSNPTFDAEIGLAHTSQTNVQDADSANPDILASNIYSKACSIAPPDSILPLGAGEDTCGIGVSVLYNGRNDSLTAGEFSGQIERLSMDGAGNTVLDMTDGSTGSAGDVVISNGGLTVDEDLVVGDVAGMLTGTVGIGGEIDQPQLVVGSAPGQTDSVLVVQNDADTQVFNVNNDGAVYAQSIGDINTGAASNWSVTEAGAAMFGSLEIAATGLDTLFQYNDIGFNGQTDYSAVDGVGVGANTGGADGRDGFYGLGCSPAGPTATFLPNGCSFRISVGRDLGNPEFEIEDKTVDSVNIPGFGMSPQALRNNIIIDAPIIQDGSNGSARIDMGHGTIQGAVQVTNLSTIGGIGAAKGGWHFAPSALDGEALSSVTLASPGQSGRNACVYASGAGDGNATVIIKPQSGCTDLYSGEYLVEFSTVLAGPQRAGSPDGQCDALARQGERTFADIIINGTTYRSGAAGAPTITSSGSIGDFVCFLSANPNSDASFEWYVLGQSGTWTGSDGL